MKQKSKKKGRAKKKRSRIRVNLTNCKYRSVEKCVRDLGWQVVDEASDGDEMDGFGTMDWNLYWTDTSVASSRVMRLKKFQKINHFPGMSSISNKAHLARNLRRLAQVFPSEFCFFPRTWVLPAEMSAFKKQFGKSGRGRKTFIIKPDRASQGKGIFLTRSYDKVASVVTPSIPDDSGSSGPSVFVAQRYVTKPKLIDGKKFDMRIYVLVTCVDPLRIFLYKDGLVRICADAYAEPGKGSMSHMTAHLTNYSVNKTSKNLSSTRA